MSESNGIDNYTQDDYQKALTKLRQVSPIQPGHGKLNGYSQDGQLVWFPGSYLAGYSTILHNRSLTIVTDIFGIVGQLSDGTWAYLPSFRDGREKALNDLRMAAMAQAHIRTFQEIEQMKKQQNEQKLKEESERKELQKMIDSLREEVTRLREEKDKREEKKN
jgi:hypothetical protein